MLAATLAEVTGLVTAVTAFLGVALTASTRRSVQAVRTEVTTANGLTIAALADRGEDRRIADIDPADRTDSDHRHAAAADAIAEEVDRGHRK